MPRSDLTVTVFGREIVRVTRTVDTGPDSGPDQQESFGFSHVSCQAEIGYRAPIEYPEDAWLPSLNVDEGSK